ncbi:MAG: 3-dehydroquinate synthase [Candidatus Dormibacteria bacterium]
MITPSAAGSRPVALVGLPGTGKTTLGRRLAESLGWQLCDTDAEIERGTGRSPAQIIDLDGEDAFRRVELATVTEMLERPGGFVIACGGGLFGEPAARRLLLQAAWVVALDAPDSTLLERLGSASDRPLLRGDVGGRLAELRRRRQRAYAEAHLRIDTGRTSPDQAEASIRPLAGAIPVPTAGSAYPVIVAEDAGGNIGAHLPADCSRVAVVTDRSVEPAARRLTAQIVASGREAPLVTLAGGEPAKSWSSAGELIETLASLGLGRRDALVAVGGGSIGDLAGFAAATYCRGIAWLGVPTTLLAMVDSSIGGKTGVNLHAAKNLAGAFWQPRAVLADPALLGGLSARELASGLGEVAKYAMIADTDLPALLDEGVERAGAGDVRTLTPIIERCAAIKAEVVGRDPREGGLRAVLNYGHTVAHAIEAAAGYGTVTHGEAVAAGMRVAGRLSTEMAGLPLRDLEWQDRLLDRIGLHPLPAVEPAAVVRRLGHDKKAVGGEVRWVLLSRRGEPVLDQRVPAELVRETLEEVLQAT